MFRGSLTLMVTPFQGAGIDERQFGAFAEWQVAEGTDGLVVADLAGEGPTLQPGERSRLVRIAVEAAAGRVPVIAATGTNSTAGTIELTRAARGAGAAAALVVAPYYSRPTQEGLVRHVEAVVRAIDIPLILANAPARTGVEIAPATLERLLALPAVTGFADESTDAFKRLANALVAAGRVDRLAVGELAALPQHLPEPEGCLSLAANVTPALCAAIDRASRDGDAVHRQALHERLVPLCQALEGAPEPVAAKYAVSLLRPAFDPAPRLPLTGITAATAVRLRSAVAGLATRYRGPAWLPGRRRSMPARWT